MTLQEAINTALKHPSPLVQLFREGSDSNITVDEHRTVYGVIKTIEEVHATDWEIFDLYLAMA